MSRSSWTLGSGSTIHDLGSFRLSGRYAHRYRLSHPFPYTEVPVVDERLSTYEVAVALPDPPAPEAPVLIGLEALAAPYRRLAYIVPALVDRGFVCVLFETPLSGTRSLEGRGGLRNLASEVAALAAHGADPSVGFMGRLMEGVAGDMEQVRGLLAERYGLENVFADSRLALFGISFGCLLSSFAFMRHGIGGRLLGAVGHADLAAFARGLGGEVQRYFGGMPVGGLTRGAAWALLRPAVERRFGSEGVGALYLFRLLEALGEGGPGVEEANPVVYADRVERARRVRLLIGAQDRVARPEDAERCTARVPDGACRVEGCLSHGYVTCGPSYHELILRFLREELQDWKG